jgi:hypothetical protein
MARLPEKRQLAGRLSLVPEAPPEPAEVGPAAPSTFARVYALHAGYVAGLAGRILGRNDDVPDVVQEVFLIVHRRLSEVRAAGALRTWLGRITVREASRRLRCCSPASGSRSATEPCVFSQPTILNRHFKNAAEVPGRTGQSDTSSPARPGL